MNVSAISCAKLLTCNDGFAIVGISDKDAGRVVWRNNGLKGTYVGRPVYYGRDMHKNRSDSLHSPAFTWGNEDLTILAIVDRYRCRHVKDINVCILKQPKNQTRELETAVTKLTSTIVDPHFKHDKMV